MGVREDAILAHPDFPWLAGDDHVGLAAYLQRRGFLEPGEVFLSSERAGEGNMNLTLRVHTSTRHFILKQSRPWVEKYPEIAAPWDRSQSELRFYERVKTIPGVAKRMPKLIGGNRADRVLLLEDISEAGDLTSLYLPASADSDGSTNGKATSIRDEEIDSLAAYLAALHSATRGRVGLGGGVGEGEGEDLANREMRALNHTHIFVIPLDPDNGLDLDAFEPGLGRAALRLLHDAQYLRVVAETGERYLRDGPCLVHADYFPGSWLRTRDGEIRVIDPEFSFPGDPEVDLGCAVAHLALASQPAERAERLLAAYAAETPDLNPVWLARYAAVEIMRRLIGVAQLPLPPSSVDAGDAVAAGESVGGQGDPSAPRCELLARSHQAMGSGRIADLF